jgi:hypothetical protein
VTANLIHMAETLAIGSIENFVDPTEIAQLVKIMDTFLAEEGAARFADARADSIHEIPGHTAVEAMAVYEPAGRLEAAKIPNEAEGILQQSFGRASAALARLMPSITTCRPWTYVDYGPGQHITPHLDGIAPDPLSWPRQIAGISIVITPAIEGGAFFVETASDSRLWHHACTDTEAGYVPGTWWAHDGADHSADWFRDMPRTRWSVNPAAGTALLYGSQLTHGTEPVRQGRARKFISWLVAERS